MCNFGVFARVVFVKFFSHARWKNGRSASKSRRVDKSATRGAESDSGAKDAKSADFIGIFWSGSEDDDVKIVSK